MLIRVAVNQVKNPFVKFIFGKMHSLCHTACRHTVQWEYINIYASQIFKMHTFN